MKGTGMSRMAAIKALISAGMLDITSDIKGKKHGSRQARQNSNHKSKWYAKPRNPYGLTGCKSSTTTVAAAKRTKIKRNNKRKNPRSAR